MGRNTILDRASVVIGKMETLEQRVFLSAVMGSEGKGNAPARPSAPTFQLAWVALHEFGHALGLQHGTDSNSIMYPYYNGAYDFSKFGSDPAVTLFKGMYTAAKVANEQTAWKDASDGTDDGHLTITYSWVRDGAQMDQGGRSNTDATFDDDERAIVVAALNKWAEASAGTVSFATFNKSTDGKEAAIYSFNAAGAVQHDSRFGDIRISTHKFDGAGGTLAHTYYPPPNGATAAGDAHFDSGETWGTSNLFAAASAPASGTFSSTLLKPKDLFADILA